MAKILGVLALFGDLKRYALSFIRMGKRNEPAGLRALRNFSNMVFKKEVCCFPKLHALLNILSGVITYNIIHCTAFGVEFLDFLIRVIPGLSHLHLLFTNGAAFFCIFSGAIESLLKSPNLLMYPNIQDILRFTSSGIRIVFPGKIGDNIDNMLSVFRKPKRRFYSVFKIFRPKTTTILHIVGAFGGLFQPSSGKQIALAFTFLQAFRFDFSHYNLLLVLRFFNAV